MIAWRDLPDLRDPDRFGAWARAPGGERRATNLRVLLPTDPTAPDGTIGVAQRDLLDRAFRRLTPEERTILVLRRYLGYEPTEIAEVLGGTPAQAILGSVVITP